MLHGAPALGQDQGLTWRILVVDNDPDVHAATRAALEGQMLFGRSLVFMHAFSGDEARSLLLREHDLAMVLIDVVSQRASAGLDLIDFIRHCAGLKNTRIVLRTGQPGQVPDLETLLRYDINDYRTKAELTSDRLLAMVVTAVRSYKQLCAVHASAYHDPLVNLPNRSYFIDKVNEFEQRGMDDHIVALIDIDDFSATNDMMGHHFGDRLLEKVARRLEESLPADVLLARLDADTFAVLGSVQQVQPRRLLECALQPLHIEGVPHKVSLTCGYVLLPKAPQPGADLIKDATIALKRAKRDHRGQHLQYADQMGTEARARAVLLSNLREAIEKQQLFLVYQPQLNLDTQQLIGLEALLRWRTEDNTFIPPDQFIPVAEHSGLILGLGQWVLATACATMRELLDTGLAPLRMAVNVSTVQLRDPGFFELVCAALAANNLEGRHLELEITESVAALPTKLLDSTLCALRAEGISIAIDDFGTGYSSLSYLERLPLDRIKIDRSFTRQLGDPHGARIAEMVADLGRKLGLAVLAEGIEDAGAWQALLAMGYQEGQGYHIAMPMDKTELRHWLGRHPERLRAA
ncbi:EAL domain-containing protein [Acidovorax sp. CCYZU-2555]|uniref:putative bifunctional diguanylate cyclase/phosphodiesterase n=1 Tax=Acidovorax sp. CCYZU-2555 TaxID=2835042 RepID=UPI0020BFCF9C|nr:EAL domain-containing protein [Acidovorax sp. CCYZU-2555]